MRAETVNLLDVVRLKADLAAGGPHRGDEATIVELFDDGRLLVEFADTEGKTRALVDVSPSDIEVVWRAPTS